ncbi:ribosomal protein L22 [Ophiobolus disseminans]|uniref:Ribosomal protein L22 n=1 Tax=Ophiobolus disseminans TaxID=1469910 RepID=A0A6A6ZUM9_9PLEO|nr:ribosomal protein L22 [Ophiobolus disseminans]
MTTRIPSRRLGQSALAAFQPRTIRWAPSVCATSTAKRHASTKDKATKVTSKPKDKAAEDSSKTKDKVAETPSKPKDEAGEDLSNPILEKYLEQREIEQGATPDDTAAKPARPRLREGKMSSSPSSLFLPEREIPGWNPNLSPAEIAQIKSLAEKRKATIAAEEDRKLSEMNLDPDLAARRALERRLVMAGVKRHGRLTKAQTLARTERQSVFKSQALPTSVKKLQKVVNQIAGKTVSEALVQLRFSKKRVARDVAKGLEIAQNEAIAGRGMGLGSGLLAQKRWEMQRAQMDTGKVTDVRVREEEMKTEAENKKIRPTTVEMKDGSKKVVRDPTEIFIEQAWVGKGEMWKTPEYRARGMVNLLRHRTTSFSVLLKEEKTRMRISDEIKKKRDNRKVWTALPDRPITSQRQYCLW